MKVLIIGYGNPGRGDDGLGPALVQSLAGRPPNGTTLKRDSQLMVDHAALLAEHDVVVFADAALDAASPCYLRSIDGRDVREASFSSHHLEPADVVALARVLYGAQPRAFVLGMRGAAYGDFEESLSETARASLRAAEARLRHEIAAGFSDRDSRASTA